MNFSDNCQKNLKRWAMTEEKFNNKQIAIAINHINLAKEELMQCSEQLYKTLQTVGQKIDDSSSHTTILEALASLQMQDIISQRLEKLKEFLSIIDKNISLPLDETYLEKFAWEREVEQNEVDAMFSSHKG